MCRLDGKDAIDRRQDRGEIFRGASRPHKQDDRSDTPDRCMLRDDTDR